MAWIDYKKVYDFVPRTWISECIEFFGIADNLRNFLEKSMKPWKLLLARGEYFRETFVLSMVHLSLVRWKINASYEWGKEIIKAESFVFHV